MAKKSIRCLWPLTQIRNKAFKSVRCPATCRSTDNTCRHSLTTFLIKISSAWKIVCNLNVTLKVSRLQIKHFTLLNNSNNNNKKVIQWLFAALRFIIISLFIFFHFLCFPNIYGSLDILSKNHALQTAHAWLIRPINTFV